MNWHKSGIPVWRSSAAIAVGRNEATACFNPEMMCLNRELASLRRCPCCVLLRALDALED